MHAGQMDRRVTIQRATETQDTAGQPVRAWEDWKQRWSRVHHLSGRELQAAQQLVADVDTEFQLRYDSDSVQITTDETYRVVYGSRIYDIRYSQEDTSQPRRSAWKLLGRARSEAAA